MCYAADLPGSGSTSILWYCILPRPCVSLEFNSYVIHSLFCMYSYHDIIPLHSVHSPGMYSKCILYVMVCITTTKYIKVLQPFESRAECIELFLFASRYDGWHLSTMCSRCRPGPGTLSELYSIVSRWYSLSHCPCLADVRQVRPASGCYDMDCVWCKLYHIEMLC